MVAAVLLLLLGLALVIAEVFFVSMGVLSVMAAAAIIAADVLAFREGAGWGWAFVAFEVVAVPLLVIGAFRVLPRLPIGRRMVLRAPPHPVRAGVPAYADLVGRRGHALVDLRPSGAASIDGERLSVVAAGGPIPADTEVEVVSVEGPEIKVRALPAPAADPVP